MVEKFVDCLVGENPIERGLLVTGAAMLLIAAQAAVYAAAEKIINNIGIGVAAIIGDLYWLIA